LPIDSIQAIPTRKGRGKKNPLKTRKADPANQPKKEVWGPKNEESANWSKGKKKSKDDIADDHLGKRAHTDPQNKFES